MDPRMKRSDFDIREGPEDPGAIRAVKAYSESLPAPSAGAYRRYT